MRQLKLVTLTNSWQRVTTSETRATNNFEIILRPNQGTSSGTVSIQIWGAHLEAGAFATSYIPTTVSQVTRSADSASMTGTNFSSWYRADEGTMYADYVPFEAGTDNEIIFQLDDTTLSNRYALYLLNTQKVGLAVLVNGAFVGDIQSTNNSVTRNQSNKFVASYAVNSFNGSSNGQTILTDSSGALPANLTRAVIGGTTASSNYVNGYIKKLAYYPRKLTNAELVSLSTI